MEATSYGLGSRFRVYASLWVIIHYDILGV